MEKEKLPPQAAGYIKGKGHLGAYVAFAILLALLFGPMFLNTTETLFTVDAPPLHEKTDRYSDIFHAMTGLWRTDLVGIGEGYAGIPFHPLRLIHAASPQTHGILYLAALILTFLGTLYYMRGIGIRGLPAGAAAIALSFTGYSFTLISAGHVGFFCMHAYLIWLFGFTHRAVTRGSPLHYALAGASLMFAMAAQPDYAVVGGIVAAIYALYLFVRVLRSAELKTNRSTYLKRSIVGGLLALLCLVATGVGTLKFFFEIQAPNRTEQFGATPKDKWIFTTNWSFPPSEMLELVAPCVFGIESAQVSPEAPYWGKIGRSYQWEATKRGFPNFRQHTVYLGVIQLLFAFFAMIYLFLRKKGKSASDLIQETKAKPNRNTGKQKKRGKPAKAKSETSSSVVRNEPPLAHLPPETKFWVAVFIIALLLSFGRHFPLYKVIYMIPGLNNLRAPIKYLRFVEFATSILFGIGLSIFIYNVRHQTCALYKHVRASHRWLIGLGISMVTILIISLLYFLSGGMSQPLSELNLISKRSALTANLTIVLFRSTLLASIVILVAYLSLKTRTAKLATIAMWLVLLAISFDAFLVGKPFIHTKDLSDSFYAENPIAESIAEETPLARTAITFVQPNRMNPFYWNWRYHGLKILGPASEKKPALPVAAFFEAFASNPKMLHQLTSTENVLIGRKQLAAFQALGYTYKAGVAVEKTKFIFDESATSPIALLRTPNALPRAAIYHRWRNVSTQKDALVAIQTEPISQIIAENVKTNGEGSPTPTIAEIISEKSNSMIIETDSDESGILMVTDTWHPDVKATLDGKPISIIRCNSIMRGVEVPAGKHRVEFHYRPYSTVFRVSIACFFILMLWWALSFKRRKELSVA